MSEVPQQFVRFFDDAATFPPGLAPVDQAVTDHVRRRSSRFAQAVGPAVLALADLNRARHVASGLDLSGEPIDVSVVTPAGALHEALAVRDQVGPELRVVALELKIDSGDRQVWTDQVRAAAAVEDVPIFVELTAEQIAADALDLLAGTGLQLKFRTGGAEAHHFPTPAQLAEVLARAIRGGIPFKLTAGLHEAVRYLDPTTGFHHHGFLNIAMAAQAACTGEQPDRVALYLAETDEAALAREATASNGTWRESFRSFGTCSVSEPAESLRRLGLLPPDVD